MVEKFGIIYLVTNTVNGKSYIGQTTLSLERRKYFHVRDSKCSTYDHSIFHRAIRKYGFENFIWEIIDTSSSKEELDDKERYYIHKYNTYIGFDDCMGYNATLGGEGNLGLSEVLDISRVIKIKELLRDTNISQRDIAKQFDIAFTTVNSIYTGRNWNHVKVDGFKPNMPREQTRPYGEAHHSTTLTVKDVIKIKELLRDTDETHPNIATQIGCSIKNVADIYHGITWVHVEVEGFKPNMNRNTVYSNRRHENILTEEDVIQIKTKLVRGTCSLETIAKEFGVTKHCISAIKRGKIWRNVEVEGFKPNTTICKGSNSPNAKLDEKKVREIKNLISQNYILKKISEMYNVSPDTISKIKAGKLWSHVNI